MKLIYNKKEIDVKDCVTFFSRLKGFMFNKEINNALMFRNCNSIHTFFMRSNIDVIFCDKDFKILYFYKDLKKNKIILPKKNVYVVIELPVNYYNFNIGDKVKIKTEI